MVAVVAAQRRGWLFAVLVLTCLLGLLWAAGQWLAAGRKLHQASEDWQQCQQLVSEMLRLRDQPRVASLSLESPQQIIDRITEAQQASALPAESLISVSPSAPVRLGSTAYQIRSTELVLQAVRLVQLYEFATVISRNDQGLVVKELVLTPQPATDLIASNTAESWNARLTLTQLIYSPTSRADSAN